MPTQVANNAGNDLASRYSYILQPIRDMTKNWDIDVAAQLEEYLTEIEKIQISFDGGKTAMNFAEAALVIQGSACIYSKKVEYLYTLVYQTLDLIASKKRLQHAATVDDQGQDKDITFKEEDDFLSLDDLKEAKNIDLKEENDILGESPLIPRTPLALIPLGERERQDVLLSQTGEVLGSRNDFKMNTCTVHSSGALLLDLAHLSLLDSSFKRLPTSTPQQPTPNVNNIIDEPIQEPLQQQPDQVALQTPDISMANGNDDYDDDFGADDMGIEPVEDCEENKDTEDRMQLRQRDMQQAATVAPKVQARDPWELLDPHDPNATGEKPFKKGKPFKIPPSILATIKETKKKRKRTEDTSLQPVLSPVHEFCAMAFHSHASKFPKNPLKAPTFKEFEYLFWIEHRRRQALEKKQKKILSQYLTQEQFEDLTAADPEYQDDNEALPASDGEAAYGGPEGGDDYDDDDGFGGPADDADDAEAIQPMALEEPPEELVVSSYEDLVRKYVEGYLLEAQHYAQESELSRRVRSWEDKILPTLQEEESHGSFDIHKYGESVLHSFQEERSMPFSEMMKTKRPWEVCRYFLATLQLANNYNVEISADGMAEQGVDTMKLKLLHMTPGHAGISSYRAPSVVT